MPEPSGYRMDQYRAPVPDTVAGGRVLHTAGVHALLQQGHPVLIDVLPAPRRPPGLRPGVMFMPLPRQDIPGSLWLPDVGRGAIDPVLDRFFRDQLAQATGHDPSRPVVFYCLAQCWMSWNATRRAASYGYSHAIWDPDGTDGWQQAGLPLATATPRTPSR